MIHLITELSKYVMIILFAIYTWYSYVVLAVRNEERQKRMYKTQTTCMFLIHLDAFMVLFAVTKELKVLIFYGAQVLFVLFLFLIYRIVYKKAARLVINHMCMLMLIGFIILTRLNFDNAVRQFEIAVAAASGIGICSDAGAEIKVFAQIYVVLLRRRCCSFRDCACDGKNERRCTSVFYCGRCDIAAVGICKDYFCILCGLHAV